VTVPFLDLQAVDAELADELDAAASRVLRRSQFILGEEVRGFEEAFARYVGTRHCVGVGNGFDALELSLRAMGVGQGDEVIVPANTYVATWLAVMAVGATPVGVDADAQTWNIDTTLLHDAITPRTRAILPVHLYGRPVDMDAVSAVADAQGLDVLEDDAQAHGAALPVGRRVGSHGRAGAWSFYPSKNLGALGDAGAVTTDDDDLADRLRSLRNYGSTRRNVNDYQGANSRLDELQAAFLQVKLTRLDEWNARRRAVADRYLTAFADTGLQLPTTTPGTVHAWHLFVVRCADRDVFRERLAAAGVDTMVHYPTPPYCQPALAGLPGARSFPVSDRLHREVVSLPISPHLTNAQVEEAIAAVVRAAEGLACG
jgi:dTDP-4-amino-4,6-dideoxygalactose transaminase